MSLYQQLIETTVRAQEENDLPDFLAESIFNLADSVRGRKDVESMLALLVEQVSLYDTYAQTGYIGMGVDDKILTASIRRINDKLNSSKG